MPDPNEVVTEPRLEKRTRRRFRVAEKKRLLMQADELPHGEKGAWLRRNGLYAGQLSTWRKELVEHGEAGLDARKPGRQPAVPRKTGVQHSSMPQNEFSSCLWSRRGPKGINFDPP